MRLLSVLLLLLLLLLTTGLGSPVAIASGGSGKTTTPSTTGTPEKTPQELSIDAYNRGIAQRDRAWELEKELAAGVDSDKKRQKLENKISKAYASATREFREAIRNDADFFEAWGSLGYSLRKSGSFEESLGAYDKALAIQPDYPQAIEYRGEAYLGLNRIDEAKSAYDRLVELNGEQAHELLGAMKHWVQERSTDPGEISVQSVKELETWIRQKEQTAGDMVGHANPGQKKTW